MQVIVPDPSYDREDKVDRTEFVRELELKFADLSDSVSIRDSDIGRAADWPAILLTVSGLFFLAKPVNDNLDAWAVLAKKFRAVLAWAASKCGAFRVVNRPGIA